MIPPNHTGLRFKGSGQGRRPHRGAKGLPPRGDGVAGRLLRMVGGAWIIAILMIAPGPASLARGEDPRARFLSGSPRHRIPLEEIYHGGPSVDGIPALVRPDTVAVSGMKRLAPEDRLMVVSFDGIVRGYPFRILNWHELVNDRVGSRAVLITYCPLCGSGVVFDRSVDTKVLTFGVSGLLYQNDVLFYDRQTDSLWSQLEGRAVVGSLTGTGLKMVAFSTMTWSAFREQYPEGEVLSFRTGYDRNYERDPYRRYRRSSRVMFPVRHQDERLHPKTPVVGLRIDGEARAYTRKYLRKRGWVTGRISDQAYVLMTWRDSIRAYRLPSVVSFSWKDGRLVGSGGEWKVQENAIVAPDGSHHGRLPFIESYWFAWLTFHPDTTLTR